MAIRGTIAKAKAEEIIKNAFGDNFIGTADKKLYVLVDDGGEKVQIAISMTCPKVGLETDTSQNTNSFIDGFVSSPHIEKTIIEMTPEEEENIQTLLKKLNL